MSDLIDRDDSLGAGPRAAAPRRWPVVGVLVAAIVGLAAGFGLAWWLQDARVQAREAARAEAAAQLEKTAGLLKASEATAAAAAEQLKQAKAAVDTATKQAADATAKLDDVRRDAANARNERDQAKASLASTRTELDRMRANDADPGLLPPLELAKALGSIRQVRVSTSVQSNGSSATVDQAAVQSTLSASLAKAGLMAGAQSPFQVRLLVMVGSEPKSASRAVGMLMMVMRTIKMPGEVGSREVAIWAQQRTAQAADGQIPVQVEEMVATLCGELGAAMGVKPPVAPAAAPAAAPASAAASPATAAPAPAPVPSPASPNGTKP